MSDFSFLSCNDTDVAKTLRGCCEPVIKRDFGHTRWQRLCLALSGDIGNGRMADGRAGLGEFRGSSATKEPSIAAVCAVSGTAHTFANF
jgi:hypothetical protein